MICPVEIAREMSALRAVRVGDHGKHGVLLEGRDGAGDENTDDRKTDSEPALDVEIAEPFAVRNCRRNDPRAGLHWCIARCAGSSLKTPSECSCLVPRWPRARGTLREMQHRQIRRAL